MVPAHLPLRKYVHAGTVTSMCMTEDDAPKELKQKLQITLKENFRQLKQLAEFYEKEGDFKKGKELRDLLAKFQAELIQTEL